MKAGAWEPDKAVREPPSSWRTARLSRPAPTRSLTIRAPRGWRGAAGECAAGASLHRGEALVWGSVHQQHVRVDIDEHDIPRFQPGAGRGRPFALNRTFTPELRARGAVSYQAVADGTIPSADTRVLQVIYAVEPKAGRALYGATGGCVHRMRLRSPRSEDRKEAHAAAPWVRALSLTGFVTHGGAARGLMVVRSFTPLRPMITPRGAPSSS